MFDDIMFGFPNYFTTAFFWVPVILALAAIIWNHIDDKKRVRNWRKYHTGEILWK